MFSSQHSRQAIDEALRELHAPEATARQQYLIMQRIIWHARQLQLKLTDILQAPVPAVPATPKFSELHRCRVCGKEFASVKALYGHQRTHR